MERLLDKKDSLLAHVVQGDLNTCANSYLETDFNVIEAVNSTRVDAVKCLENGISKLKIRSCQNTRCSNIKAALANAAPTCEWAPFRDWALVVMSCWHVMTHPDPAPSMQPSNNLPPSSTSDASAEYGGSLEVAVEFCADLLLRRRWQPDAFDIFEVILWIAMASASVPSPNHTHSTFEDAELEVPTIRDALDNLYRLHVCQHRVWNLVNASRRKAFEIPNIVSMVQRFPLFHTRDHQHCIAETCLFDDDNSTIIQQLHKCGSENCMQERFFPPAHLDSALRSGFASTAWTISEQTPSPDSQSYMAISHVWSDGTGVGLKAPGVVNDCLSNFFAQLARELECDGIWWDAVCIPTDRDMQRIALNRMHDNYQNAKCTLVHDQELVDFEWREDGSPCVALALSSWFTRGWTALELQVSRSVKVLFRDARSRISVIKDLDTDILAEPKDYFAHPAHRAASQVIQRLRGAVTDDFDEPPISRLVAMIRPRHTSWARDRMIIAGLMAHVDGFDSSWPQSKITQSILSKFGSITGSALLHGQVTVSNSGPWSWCPTSLLDLMEETPRGIGKLDIDRQGTVTGRWLTLPLDRAEVLEPENCHMSVRLRVRNALREAEKHLLLFPITRQQKLQNRHLLVRNLGMKFIKGELVRICRYIGTVIAYPKQRGRSETIQLGSEETGGFLQNHQVIDAKDCGGWTSLHFAVFNEDKEAIKAAIADSDIINAMDNKGWTALHWALFHRQSARRLDIAKYLVEKGADVTVAGWDRTTPLHLAASNGYDPNFLLNKADTDVKDRNGRTPLHLAALNGHLVVAEALVQAGATLAAKDRDERMPSHLAMEQGNLNLMEFLVKTGDVDARDRHGRTLLHSAASQVMALAHIVPQAESKEATHNTASGPNGSTPLQNGLTLMRAEIFHSNNTNDGSKQTTQHLKYQGAYGTIQRPAAEALLSLQADPDAVDRDLRTPLHVAAIRGAPLSETIIQILIKGGASVDKKDQDGRTALHLAALGGHLGASKVLVEQGAVVLEKDRNNRTPLHLAISEGHLDVATYLVEEGADLTSWDRDGHAPLHLAAKNGHLQIVMFLVEKRADIPATDRDDNTALHLAASEGFLDVVKFLVQSGSSLSTKNRDEQSPLHITAQKGHLDVVRFLVGKGADIHARDRDHNKPLHLAAWERHYNVAKFLEERSRLPR